MNYFPWHGMFFKRTIDDWSHRKINDVLLWIFFFLNSNCININEVHYLLVYFFNFSFDLEFLPFICAYSKPCWCLSSDASNLVIMFEVGLKYCVCGFLVLYYFFYSGIMMFVLWIFMMTRPNLSLRICCYL